MTPYLDTPLAQLRPWETPEGVSPQREFLRAAREADVRVYRGGNRSGKTFAGAWDLVAWITGHHPFLARPDRPVQAWVSALDRNYHADPLWPAIRALLPPGDVRSVSYVRRAEPEIPAAVTLRDGSRIVFKSAESGRSKYQASEVDYGWVDEEHPADVVEELRTRLLKSRGPLVVTCTPVTRARWVLDLEREPGTTVIRASMLDAARAGLLDLVAVQRFLDQLPERQRRVRELGDFGALEGLVYPGYHQSLHHVRPVGGRLVTDEGEDVAPWPIPAEWWRFAAMDFGYANPASVVVAALNPHRDALVVEHVYHGAERRISWWAGFLKERLPRLRTPLICDHDAGDRAELEHAGIPTRPARKDVVPGLETVERWLHPGPTPRLHLVVHDPSRGDDPPRERELGRVDAHPLSIELSGYRYPRPRGGENAQDVQDHPLKRDDHSCDALRYLVVDVDRYRGTSALPPEVQAAPTPGASALGRQRGRASFGRAR